MKVIISARHCSPPTAVRELAESRIRRLQRYEPRIGDAEVAFDEDHGEPVVEARVSVHGGGTVVADATGETFEAAVRRMVDRLGRQLRRRRERRRDHQAVKLSELEIARSGGM